MLVVIQVESVEHAFGEVLCAVQAEYAHVLLEGLAGDDAAAD